MGIDNIDILIDLDAVPRKEVVSQHIVEQDKKKYVFGWDQSFASFFLQVHDLDKHEEENPVVWLGIDSYTKMYEVGDLVQAAQERGLEIDQETQTKLFEDRDRGA